MNLRHSYVRRFSHRGQSRSGGSQPDGRAYSNLKEISLSFHSPYGQGSTLLSVGVGKDDFAALIRLMLEADQHATAMAISTVLADLICEQGE